MLTPFSGLSLLVHLAVIGLAKISRIGRASIAPYVEREAPSILRRRCNSAFSIVVILAISSIMLISFALALTTSLREAGKVWHVEFINRAIEDWRERQLGPLQYIAERQSDSSPQQSAANGVGVPPYRDARFENNTVVANHE